ncbi:AAA family ATPase [Clostridium sp. BNL1100]|uniref:ATP-binding protein n=1 Tax=Clostridium sp. BNL1100 TaxID=755731 RepID=UPI00024A7772|nr:AAA family ATPase [Clostridium sp. BNL1100]AEY64328.1 hypothetical protein Clo1100_0035 [Clostridium sp. BNL1100]
MKIDRLHVRGFGKLQDFSCDFSDGLNVIYGDNESGKSTLMAYIKAMMYGVKGGRAGKNGMLPESKRYMPWNNNQYGGYMNIKLDNGEFYRIDRDFLANKINLYDSSFNDISANFIDIRDINSIGEKLVGLNENLFERTVFIKQMGTRIDTSTSKDLVDRISNIQQSGFEDISYIKAQNALKEALKRQVGTDRSYTRPLDIINQRIAELQEKKVNLLNEEKRLEELREKQQDISLKINKLKFKYRLLSRIIDYCKLKEKLKFLNEKKEEIRFLEESVRQAQENITKLEEDKKSAILHLNDNQVAGGKKLRGTDVFLTICVIATLAVGLAAFVFNILSPLFTLIPFLSTFILFILRTRTINREAKVLQKDRTDELNRQLSHFDDRIAQNKTQYQKLTGRIEGLKANNGAEKPENVESEISRLYIEITKDMQKIEDNLTHHESELIEDISKDSFENLLVKAFGINKNVFSELQRWETEYNTVAQSVKNTSTDSISDIENEISRLSRQKKSLDSKGEALNIAINTLESAAEQVRKKYVPLMNKVLNNTFSGLTSQKYNDVRTGDNLKIMLDNPETETLVPVSMLSDGTIDQIYLALRVAISETVLKNHECMPFIMDEPFAQYDDERTLNALKYIGDISKKQQVIIFTCKKREVELIGSEFPCKICSLT